eukprot:scaffold5682_cov140-Cylindrotheca_fusiformis.AAC.11
MTPAANDPAEARKRRKEIIQSQRSDIETAGPIGPAESSGTAEKVSLDQSGAAEKKPPKKRKVEATSGEGSDDESAKKKTQIRYDPEVPMSKEQLAAWRREARRVRNRESAAASRQRIRNRISELEVEVGEWKTKYSQAMQRLQSLQQTAGGNGPNDSTTVSLCRRKNFWLKPSTRPYMPARTNLDHPHPVKSAKSLPDEDQEGSQICSFGAMESNDSNALRAWLSYKTDVE